MKYSCSNITELPWRPTQNTVHSIEDSVDTYNDQVDRTAQHESEVRMTIYELLFDGLDLTSQDSKEQANITTTRQQYSFMNHIEKEVADAPPVMKRAFVLSNGLDDKTFATPTKLSNFHFLVHVVCTGDDYKSILYRNHVRSGTDPWCTRLRDSLIKIAKYNTAILNTDQSLDREGLYEKLESLNEAFTDKVKTGEMLEPNHDFEVELMMNIKSQIELFAASLKEHTVIRGETKRVKLDASLRDSTAALLASVELLCPPQWKNDEESTGSKGVLCRIVKTLFHLRRDIETTTIAKLTPAYYLSLTKLFSVDLPDLFQQYDDYEVVENYTTSELVSNNVFLQDGPQLDTILKREDMRVSQPDASRYTPPLSAYSQEQSLKYQSEAFVSTCDREKYDLDNVTAFGKAKESEIRVKHLNHEDITLVQDIRITAGEAAHMQFKDRPSFYKSMDSEMLQLDKPMPINTEATITSKSRIEELLEQGVDARLAFGGYAGGHCELLIYSPNGKQDQLWHTLEDPKRMHPKCQPDSFHEYFGSPGLSWMNLDDILGGGVDTFSTTTRQANPGEYVWTGGEDEPEYRFKYYPGESLLDNHNATKKESKRLDGMRYVTFADQSTQRRLKESIPIYDCSFVFHSLAPI